MPRGGWRANTSGYSLGTLVDDRLVPLRVVPKEKAVDLIERLGGGGCWSVRCLMRKGQALWAFISL